MWWNEAGTLTSRKGKAALIALVLGVLTLSLTGTVAQPPAAQPMVGYAGLRPDWLRLPLATPAPPPTVVAAAPAPQASPTVAAPAPVKPPEPSEPMPAAAISPPAAPPPVEPPEASEPIPAAAIWPPAEAPASAAAAALPTTDPAPPPTPAVTEGPDPPFAQMLLDLTNQARLANGLVPLAADPALAAAAQEYAELHALLSPDRLDHRLNGSNIDSRAEAEGYSGWTLMAENLVWCSADPSPSPADVVQQWLASAAHRDNILNPTLNETGVGCYVRASEQPFRICVQDFGARP
jgi:uncharacterized protein YkwD